MDVSMTTDILDILTQMPNCLAQDKDEYGEVKLCKGLDQRGMSVSHVIERDKIVKCLCDKIITA